MDNRIHPGTGRAVCDHRLQWPGPVEKQHRAQRVGEGILGLHPFRQLGARISELENQTATRREFFNDSVNLYNIRIERFLDFLVARPFGFAPRLLWKIDPAHRADVKAEFRPA